MKSENSDQNAGTVLVVDDSVDILDIIRHSLENFTKFKVLTAVNGQEALKHLESQAIEVILLD
ncbi:MAG: response regulator, partial [Proteobacteria bacterium]|nr:response regulator [Pseudomonadota bacterium]